MTRACTIDHLTITAPTLAEGADWLRDQIGILPQPGGQHPRMGTHNLLLRLGDRMFLEIIAIDPAAPTPSRPRWFALDKLAADSRARLATWVARTPDIRNSSAKATETLGAIEPMSRGSLEWLITIPADGSLAQQGTAPTLIEWGSANHPADKLPDHGLSLQQLEIHHPEPVRLQRLLSALDVQGSVTVTATPTGDAPYLVAHIDTPQGIRQLSGRLEP